MTAEHRCDSSILEQTDHNPLTLSRTLRLLLASLDDTADPQTAATPVLEAIGGCSECLSLVLISMTGIATSALMAEPREQTELVAAFNGLLAQLLDELTRQP